MAKSNSQKVKVGIFVVVGTVILVLALYFIGSRQHLFSKTIHLYAVFENVSGLQLGNNVRYSGINVGTVTKIEMKEIGKITVEMSVEEKSSYFIKKDAIASISSDGLVGSMVVNIVPGSEQKGANVASGDFILSYNSVSTDEMLKTLNKTNENAVLLSSDLLKITHQILEGEGTLGALLNDPLMADNIRKTALELKKTSEGANLAVSNINQIISKINYDESAAAVLLSNPETADQVKTVFNNLEKSSNDINVVTQNLEEYIQEIKSGKGAVNHLTQDEDFVKDLDATMIQIKEASEKLNENMEALKHNFLFRGYFNKLDRIERREARKAAKEK